MRIVNPMNEASGAQQPPAPRLESLDGKRIALLDISKPGGSHFLARLGHLLHQRFGADVAHFIKPPFTRPAPEEVLAELAAFDAVIEGLAD